LRISIEVIGNHFGLKGWISIKIAECYITGSYLINSASLKSFLNDMEVTTRTDQPRCGQICVMADELTDRNDSNNKVIIETLFWHFIVSTYLS
jgi:hypothetical protein